MVPENVRNVPSFPFSILVLAVLILLSDAGCKSVRPGVKVSSVNWELNDRTFRLSGISQNESHGFDQNSPMEIAAGNPGDSLNIGMYFNALTGPDNEPVHWQFINRCCFFDHPLQDSGKAYLHFFELYHDNSPEPLFIYLNIWETDTLVAPAGFGYKKDD